MKIFIILFLIATLSSCQSRRAREFNVLLDSTEQRVFWVLSADDTEQSRLRALVDQKPDRALSLGRKQARELTAIISELDRTNVNEIPDANHLKKCSFDYYEALLRLKQVDILEAELMRITLQNDTARARKAANDISDLIRKRIRSSYCFLSLMFSPL